MKARLLLVLLVLTLTGTSGFSQAQFDYQLEWSDSCRSLIFSVKAMDLTPYYPYPTKPFEQLKQGLTIVEFSLDESCRAYNERIIKSIDSKLDSLSLEIIEDFTNDLRSNRHECCPVESMKFPIKFVLR